jgi:putative membrane protein
MSRFVYVCVFLHVCILIYGGMYTYAKTPLGNWVRDTFHLARNDYDRVGHLALGVFPVFLTREVLLRRTPLKRGAWLTFLLLCVILAIAAFWELLEWWVALLSSPETGNAFLATQGDIWDTQWDMFLALVGAVVALPLLSRLHDRSMRKLGVTA